MIVPFSNESPISIRFREIMTVNSELKQLIIDRLKEYEYLTSVVLGYSLVEEVILYGSTTQGCATEDSDFDTLLICPTLDDELAEASPGIIMQNIVSYLLKSLKKHYEVIIDYPSITILNKDNLNQFDFTPAVAVRKFSTLMDKDFKIFINEEDTKMVKVFITDETKIERSIEEIAELQYENENYSGLVRVFKFWKEAQRKEINNIPTYIFNWVCSNKSEKEMESEKSIQERFYSDFITLHIWSNTLSYPFSSSDNLSLLDHNNASKEIIKSCSLLTSEAIRFETNSQFTLAMNCWDKIFNGKFITT